jgi:hypothetical protein
MTWHDPNMDETLLPGKFELNVHSNDCYTAGGPSKLVGLFTITDLRGRSVPNPVFEWDTCFNPNGSNRPTGVTVTANTTTTTATTPAVTEAALTLPHGAVRPDAHGRIAPLLSCSAGEGGCAGTVTATADGRDAGSFTYVLKPGQAQVAHFQLSRTARRLTLRARPVIGATATSVTQLAVER